MNEPCGSKPCTEFVDRLGKTMTAQQKAGIEAIKDLMQVHHGELKEDVAELKATIKDQGDEIFPRLRKIEEKIAVLDAANLTETKVKELVSENETVKWTTRRRSFESAVAKVVLATFIIAAGAALITMYVDHQNAKNATPKAQGVAK